MSGEVRKKFQMTALTMPNNFSFMNYAEKYVPGLADVGVPHGDGDGPRTPSRCLEVVRKKSQMTILTMANNFCYMKYSLKSVPGLADVGVLYGDGDGPRSPPRWLDGSGKSFKLVILLCLRMSLL